MKQGILSSFCTQLLTHKLSKAEKHWNNNVVAVKESLCSQTELSPALRIWKESSIKDYHAGYLCLEEALDIESLFPKECHLNNTVFPIMCQRKKRYLTPFSSHERVFANIFAALLCIPLILCLIISHSLLVKNCLPSADFLFLSLIHISTAVTIVSGTLCLCSLLILLIATLCDERAHLIPFELSYCLGALGFLYAILITGIKGFLLSLALLGLLYFFFKGSSLICKQLTSQQGIGSGDLRTIPLLSSFCVAGAGLKQLKDNLLTGIPFFPSEYLSFSQSFPSSESSSSLTNSFVSFPLLSSSLCSLSQLITDSCLILAFSFFTLGCAVLLRTLFEKQFHNTRWKGLSTRIPMAFSITCSFTAAIMAPHWY